MQSAQLQGADLSFANLQGASLTARLEGADLTSADLQGANLTGAWLQGAYLSGAHLQGARLYSARLWQVYWTKPADFSLADLRDADFHTPLTENETGKLRHGLDAVPSGDFKREAEKRLERVLAADGFFDFVASRERPVLVSASDIASQPALRSHPDWLIAEPTAAYTGALAAYLASELASTDPAIAAGIARNLIQDISADQSSVGGPAALARAVPIACRLLSETKAGRIKLGQSLVAVAYIPPHRGKAAYFDQVWPVELSHALKNAKQDCPAVAPAVSGAEWAPWQLD
jgi:hypothetical protein